MGTAEYDFAVGAREQIYDLTTSVGDNPWNIFTSNVAALYYF